MISWKAHAIYLLDYQHWANDRLLESLDKLDDEARRRDLGVPYKSALGTLQQIVALNASWLSRMQDGEIGGNFESVQLSEWRDLKLALRQSVRQMQHWLESRPEDWFEGELSFRTGSHAEVRHWVKDVLVHLSSEADQLRGEVCAIAPILGAPMPQADFLRYRFEMQQTLANTRRAG